uniref:Uncharacterized protein n=1 Tax=Populus trichocarpa TaxID=3694 RepID=A0A2K1ZTS6_POPTR
MYKLLLTNGKTFFSPFKHPLHQCEFSFSSCLILNKYWVEFWTFASQISIVLRCMNFLIFLISFVHSSALKEF